MVDETNPVIDLQKDIAPAYWRAYYDRSRFLHLFGGAGSGKSQFASQKILLRTQQERGHRILVLRKVARTLRHSVFARLKAQIKKWHLTGLADIREGDMLIKFPATDGEIIFAGLDDVEKLKSVDGITSIWIEEGTELTIDDLLQLDMRLRGVDGPYKQIIISYNPIRASHWLNKEIHKKRPPGHAIYKTTVDHNPFIDEEYIGRLDALADVSPEKYKVYRKGEWGVFAGLIYKEPNLIPVSKFPTTLTGNMMRLYGQDFGFNNPAATVECVLDDFNFETREGDLYIRELVYETNLTTPALVSLMLERGVLKGEPLVCDSADPGRIKELEQAGFYAIGANKGARSVTDGIALLQGLRIHVTEDSVNLINEFSTYAWRKDKDGNTLDEPVKVDDHALDAVRYAVSHQLHEYGAGFGVSRS